MKTYYEYEALNLRKNPVYIRKFTRHNSNGRIHWHEPLELLYFVEGTSITSCNLQEYKAYSKSDMMKMANRILYVLCVRPTIRIVLTDTATNLQGYLVQANYNLLSYSYYKPIVL